ncbi:D-lactonohydrolase-like protein [Cristinia sonorae]|uniref:D-lactonohydrolase-like protein n=1 Tax=Cristinia sonorae TaxID=1940300 RepID=A0A8K0XJT8_9AGAR|nr:D-lactonohydrolase-like protein [Cristinia sonorae]
MRFTCVHGRQAVLFTIANALTAATAPTVSGSNNQVVFINPKDTNVFGPKATFRDNTFGTFFNPTNTAPPFFQAFHPSFSSVLGRSPSIKRIASDPTFAFAHEAPIWLEETDEVTFASNAGGPLGRSDLERNNQVGKISLKEAERMIENGVKDVNVTVTKFSLPETVQMTNGGTGPVNGSLLLVNSGRGSLPPSIVLANPQTPFNATVLLDNYFGRQFNSINDVKIHPISKAIFFTDPPYGYLNGFRPEPLLPSQVYRFDPFTGVVSVVADGFDRMNGIAFTQDGDKVYIGDSGAGGGFLGNNQTEPATIYAFDVDPVSQTFRNRSVFAFVDTGIPDGLQIDTQGNVYAGCGDGIHVFNPSGLLIGKIYFGTSVANMVFAGKGRLVVMRETEVYLVTLDAEGLILS